MNTAKGIDKYHHGCHRRMAIVLENGWIVDGLMDRRQHWSYWYDAGGRIWLGVMAGCGREKR